MRSRLTPFCPGAEERAPSVYFFASPRDRRGRRLSSGNRSFFNVTTSGIAVENGLQVLKNLIDFRLVALLSVAA